MRYSKRLLLEAETEAQERRESIEHFAADLDTLGEILSTAHYSGIRWDVCTPHKSLSQILLWTPNGSEFALLRFLKDAGATTAKNVEHNGKLQHTLQVPGMTANACLITPLLDPEADARTMQAQEAA
ncbi:hypothetical protein HI806_09150 [Ralstonia solanacearum]|nr:hypothetical protein BCR16_08845 [Ralstonia solanacearum FJAT-1458]QKL71434.1 hypothetical protein HI806_09150 [Ralstonia solanacearum]QKL76643.1 hypothetical protein HI805_09160 [Ralstonia solanacearum]QKL81847.1 hypothetical protein HI804_09160 [Ralstonia solanacearum]QKL87058.1 hypothetical protein HI803_09165 [Ralstonia solanacearum]